MHIGFCFLDVAVSLVCGAVAHILAHFGYAFLVVMRQGSVEGAPFPTPVVGTTGVAVAAGGRVVMKRSTGRVLVMVGLVGEVWVLLRKVIFGVQKMSFDLFDRE